MTTVLAVALPKMQFNQGGIPLAGGKLFTYISNTATKLATYTDYTGSTPNTNPIILDTNGQCQLWLAAGRTYTLVLSPSTDTDPPTNAYWTVNGVVGVDNIAGDLALYTATGTNAIALTTATTWTPITAYADGQIIMFPVPNTTNGAVTLNINTIGALPLYLSDGLTQATTLTQNNLIMAVYQTLLNSGGGGWKIINFQPQDQTASSTGSLMLPAFGVVNALGRPYLAKGDGVTNDTAAVQAALTSAAGREMKLPAGTYLIDTVTAASSSLIYGASSGTILISRSGGNVLTCTTQAVSITVRDMAIYGQNYLSGGSATGNGLAFQSTVTTARPSNMTMIGLDMRGFAVAISQKLCANTILQNLFLTHNSAGVVIDTCADTDLNGIKVQNDPARGDNTGPAFTFKNTLLTGAFNEGIRAVSLSSNGQWSGVLGQDQDFLVGAACSFTTCLTNAVVVEGCTNWKVSAWEIDPASAFASLLVQSGTITSGRTGYSSQLAFDAIQCAGGTYGALISGLQIAVRGVFTGNSINDLAIVIDPTTMSASKAVSLVGNVCNSTVTNSIAEGSGNDYNMIVANLTRGATATTGTHTVAVNNLVVV